MSSANVTSIEALRRFKAALVEFEADVVDAITMLELEAQRPVDWIETDRTLYWPREVQKADARVKPASEDDWDTASPTTTTAPATTKRRPFKRQSGGWKRAK